MSANKIIQAFARKILTKNQGSGITTIPNQFAADARAGEILTTLKNAGLPINQLDDYIRSEKDLLKFLNIIEATNKPTVYSGQAAMDQLNKLFPKKGEVVKFPQKRSFKEEIEAMKKSGDIVDEDNMVISEKITDREMFKDASKRFNKTDIVADSVAKITSMEPVAAMKEANKIIKREGIYKNLNKDQSQAILKSTDDWINQRDPSDLYDYNKNRPFRDDPNFDPDDPDYQDFVKNRDRDDYYTGGMVDVEPSLSDIGHGSDSLMARTRLVSPNNQATTSTGLNYLLAEDNDNIRVPFAGGYNVPSHQDYLKQMETDLHKHFKRYKKIYGGKMKFNQFRPKFIKEYAEGGRIGFSSGGMGRRAFLKLMAALTGTVAAAKSGILSLGGKGAAKKTLPMITTPNAPGKPEWFDALVTRVIREGDDVTKKFATKEREIVHRKKIDDETEVIVTQDLDNNVTRVDIDDSIRNVTGFDDPPTVSLQVTDEIVEEGGVRTKPKFQATENDYRNYATDPDGGYETEFVDNTVENTKDLTSDLTKIKSFATNKKETMKEFIESKKRKDNVKYANERTSEYAADRGPDYDPSDYIEDMADDMATGGRAGFSPGGLANVLARLGIKGSSRRFLEKAFGKENFENMIKNDPDMHRGLLEVVEMFRNRDKEGLKIYMQKFLPHMDDVEIEQFIVGTTPDIEGLTGQLTRLGSGRDYAGKLEMMKKADQVKKLQNFDIKNVTKNAEGGRIELKGGGEALKAIINYFAKQAGKKGSQQLKDINPKAIDSGILNIMGPEHLKMLQKNQTDYLESLLNIIKSDKKFLNNLKTNTDEAIAQAPIGMEDFAKEITESIKRSAMKGSRFDRMKVYDKVDIDDAIVDVEQMIKNRRVKESDGRALNASGGLQAMLGE